MPLPGSSYGEPTPRSKLRVKVLTRSERDRAGVLGIHARAFTDKGSRKRRASPQLTKETVELLRRHGGGGGVNVRLVPSRRAKLQFRAEEAYAI